MSHIKHISIKNYRGIEKLEQDFGDEKFIVLIGRGDSVKSTILSSIHAALSPAWNMSFSDLDFYNQDTSKAIEIELTIKELPVDLLKDSKFGFYVQNELDADPKELFIVLKLTVDNKLEPRWTVLPRKDSDTEEKPISGADRALLAVNFISDYTDNQFAYNRQSPLYALTKASLQEDDTIERVKSTLLRLLTSSISNEQFDSLNGPLESLKSSAERLGLKISDLRAQIDLKENPYTGNSISLHNDSLPYRLNGKGSKRLMSVAIQSELTKQGGIVLVDEIEQGLEPDRIVNLVRILKNTSIGQVFITTHNREVVTECNGSNLYIRRKNLSCLLNVNQECQDLPDISNVSQHLHNLKRYNPDVFFAKHIILCEGDTEQGFMQAVDDWLLTHHGTSFSSHGVVVANVGGGANMFIYALILDSLGFSSCIFADNDKSNEHKEKKEACKQRNIGLFLCDEGLYLEQQICHDMTINGLNSLISCSQEGFPKTHNIPKNKLVGKIQKAQTDSEMFEVKNDIATMANKDKWFKHIPGGQFLGQTFLFEGNSIQDTTMCKNITAILNCCKIKYD